VRRVAQAEYDKWASQFTPQELKEIQSGRYQVLDFDTNQFVAVPKKAYEEREALYRQFPEAGTSPGKISLPEAIEARQKEYETQLGAVWTAEQAREQELAEARVDTLPEPEVTWTSTRTGETVSDAKHNRIVDDWEAKRDDLIRSGEMYTDEWFRLGAHPESVWMKNIPAIRDTVREIITLGGWLGGGLDTYTYNRPELEKQYEQQKGIALATFMGDKARLNELYQAGAFGDDEKIPTWWYKGKEISADERDRLLAESDANRDYMTVAKGISTPPQAYKDALATIQQQEAIEAAVKAGDVPQLEQLYQEGAFGDDLAAYANLAKYVEEGGRELAPVTAQDVTAVSEGFGTKKEYVDAVLAEQPTTASMVKDVAIAMVPVYGTVYFWDKMGTGMKAVGIATDALSLIPIVGGISAAAKVAAGVGRGARIASAMKVIPKLVTREVFAPIETTLHPVQTVKALGSTAKGLVNVLNPRHIPGSTLSTVYSTVRLDTAILGDPVAAMYVRDQLMALQAAGKRPVVQFGDKVFTLRSGTFLDEGGVVHASPNIRFAGEPEGFTVSTKAYPPEHPKAGQKMPDSEQGMFVANVALERFAVGGSAFGFEKGAASAAENIKVLTEAAEQAKALGDIKKANKLVKLVDDYNAATASKSIKALDKAENKIVSKLTDMAEDEIVAKVNAARAIAGERYAIGDIKGAQEAMQEALSYEKQLEKARPGFAIFSPEVNEILVPSGKTYKGMLFQPKAGEFWSIAMKEMKQDKAAQLLKQAQDATRLGDKATAAKLTKEAHDLIGKGKSGFRKVETTEMELKFPELTQMQQLKPRYATTASETGTKLWIYTTEPYSFKKAIKAKLMAPIDTLRNIYDPAIRVKTIPMTRAQKLAKIEELLEQAKVADKAGDAEKAVALTAEVNVLKQSLDRATKLTKTTKGDAIAELFAQAEATPSIVKIDNAGDTLAVALSKLPPPEKGMTRLVRVGKGDASVLSPRGVYFADGLESTFVPVRNSKDAAKQVSRYAGSRKGSFVIYDVPNEFFDTWSNKTKAATLSAEDASRQKRTLNYIRKTESSGGFDEFWDAVEGELEGSYIGEKFIPPRASNLDEAIENILKQQKIGEVPRDYMVGIIRRSDGKFSADFKRVAGAKSVVNDAVIQAIKMDRADELIQASKRAEAVGDYASADRLRRAADAIAGRRYVNAVARRAGTVSGLAEYARALGAIRLDERGVPTSRDMLSRVAGLPERRPGETVRDTARRVGRTDVRADRLPPRIPEARVSEIRTTRTSAARRVTETARAGRTPDVTRTPDTVRIPREPVERVTDTRLPRGADARVTRTPDGRRILDTGRYPEIPRIPRTPETPRRPIKTTDTTITRLRLQGVSIEDGQARLPDNSVVWRQGIFWKWIPREDFVDGVKPRTLPKGITPLGAKFTGLRTPQETIQVIGDTGVPVPDFRVDLGKTDIVITNQAQTIRYTGKGEQTNVGDRIPNTTQGMTVNSGRGGINRPAMTDYYPEHSVSKPHITKTSKEPIRGGDVREIRGKDRVEITKRTKRMLEGEELERVKPKPAKKSKSAFSDLLELTDADMDDIFGTGERKAVKKPVNRLRHKRTQPRRGRDNPPTMLGGTRP